MAGLEDYEKPNTKYTYTQYFPFRFNDCRGPYFKHNKL